MGNLHKQGKHAGIVWKYGKTNIVAFATKPVGAIFPCPVITGAEDKFVEGDFVPGFLMKADINVIKQSLIELKSLIDQFNWQTIVLPAPGIGAGELDWNVVLNLLASFFQNDSRIIVVKKEKKDKKEKPPCPVGQGGCRL